MGDATQDPSFLALELARFSFLALLPIGRLSILSSMPAKRAIRLNLAEYENVEQLGQGVKSIVYKARHRRTGEFVAIKTIKKDYLATDREVAGFLRQVQL
jgi:serine/threonine protein kinase